MTMMSSMKNTAEDMKKKKSSMLMEACQNMNMMNTIGHKMGNRSDMILQWLRKTWQRSLKHVRTRLTATRTIYVWVEIFMQTLILGIIFISSMDFGPSMIMRIISRAASYPKRNQFVPTLWEKKKKTEPKVNIPPSHRHVEDLRVCFIFLQKEILNIVTWVPIKMNKLQVPWIRETKWRQRSKRWSANQHKVVA